MIVGRQLVSRHPDRHEELRDPEIQDIVKRDANLIE